MDTKDRSPRRRNISWDERADEIAEAVAHHSKIKGGVSEYLRRLVMDDIRRKKTADIVGKFRPDLIPQ